MFAAWSEAVASRVVWGPWKTTRTASSCPKDTNYPVDIFSSSKCLRVGDDASDTMEKRTRSDGGFLDRMVSPETIRPARWSLRRASPTLHFPASQAI